MNGLRSCSAYTIEYYSAFKKGNPAIGKMDRSWGPYAKWNKPGKDKTNNYIVSLIDEISKKVQLIETLEVGKYRGVG